MYLILEIQCFVYACLYANSQIPKTKGNLVRILNGRILNSCRCRPTRKNTRAHFLSNIKFVCRFKHFCYILETSKIYDIRIEIDFRRFFSRRYSVSSIAYLLTRRWVEVSMSRISVFVRIYIEEEIRMRFGNIRSI